jgi:hypothetical protein
MGQGASRLEGRSPLTLTLPLKGGGEQIRRLGRDPAHITGSLREIDQYESDETISPMFRVLRAW